MFKEQSGRSSNSTNSTEPKTVDQEEKGTSSCDKYFANVRESAIRKQSNYYDATKLGD